MTRAWHSRVPSVPKTTLTIAGETFTVRFDTESETARANPGTGEVELQLNARMSNPSALPAAVTPGVITIATVSGVEYLLRLVGSVDSRIQAARNVTGEKIRFAAIELQAWTRTRETEASKDPDTGAPVEGPPDTGNPKGHFIWLTERSKQDYRADAAAILLTQPGQVQAGDTLEHATYGTFIALDGAPTPLGPIDRIELRRA